MSDEILEAGAETPPSDDTPDEGGKSPEWLDKLQLRADLRQRDYYAFEDVAYKLGGFKGGTSQVAERALKAAIEADWLEAPDHKVLEDKKGKKFYYLDGEDVDDMHPYKVMVLGGNVLALYNRHRMQPPN